MHQTVIRFRFLKKSFIIGKLKKGMIKNKWILDFRGSILQDKRSGNQERYGIKETRLFIYKHTERKPAANKEYWCL